MSPSGVRVVGPGASFRVCWGVESTYTTPDLGERVDYVVEHGGSPVLTGSTSDYVRAQPNFCSTQSRMPGAPTGQAPIRCYSLDLPLDSLPRGGLTVSATAHGHDGTSAALETIVVWNDEAGVQDSRPSSTVVHWRPQTGNNSNGGTSSSDAVRDLPRAIALVSVGGVCGGARIIVHENITGNGNPGGTGNTPWRTDDHWLTIEAAEPGITWTAHNAPSTNLSSGAGGDAIYAVAPSAGQKIKVWFKGLTCLGGGVTLYDSSGATQVEKVWEGGEYGSTYWDDNGPRVRFLEDLGPTAGGPMDIQNNSGRAGKHYLVGCLVRGVGVGLTAHDIVYDCEIRDHLGGTLYAAGWPTAKCVFHSIIASSHNYERNLTRGWGCNRVTDFDLQPLESEDRGGGVMRILGPVGGHRFDVALADNVGSTRTRLGIAKWPGTGDATGVGSGTPPTGAHLIVGAGLVGGRPYVDIEHTAATYGPAPAGAEIETVCEWNPGGGSWIWFNVRIHPSSLSRQPNRGIVVFRDIAPFDSTQEVQSHFNNRTQDLQGLLIDNIRDAGTGANWQMGYPSPGAFGYRNCIFRRISAPASGMILTAGPSYEGFQITNCVFRSAPAALAGLISGGADVAYNHFVEGTAGQGWHGSNASFGTYYGPGSSHGADPWTFEPLTIGNGDIRAPEPGGLAWANVSSTKGCLRDVALLDWSLGAAPDAVLMEGQPMANVAVQNPTVQHFTAGVALTGGVDDEGDGLIVYEGASPGDPPRPMAAGTFGTTSVAFVGAPIDNVQAQNPAPAFFTAGAAMTGTAIADTGVPAITGGIEAEVLFTGAAIDDVAAENPAGTMGAGAVLFIGAAIDDVDAQAPAGDLFAHALMQGAAIADTDAQAPAGNLIAGGLITGATLPITSQPIVAGDFGVAEVPEPEEPDPPPAAPRARKQPPIRPWSPPPLARRPWRTV